VSSSPGYSYYVSVIAKINVHCLEPQSGAMVLTLQKLQIQYILLMVYINVEVPIYYVAPSCKVFAVIACQ